MWSRIKGQLLTISSEPVSLRRIPPVSMQSSLSLNEQPACTSYQPQVGVRGLHSRRGFDASHTASSFVYACIYMRRPSQADGCRTNCHKVTGTRTDVGQEDLLTSPTWFRTTEPSSRYLSSFPLAVHPSVLTRYLHV